MRNNVIIHHEISRFVKESAANRHPGSEVPYFDEPLVEYAALDDPLFAQYRDIIGDFHLTPKAFLESAFGPGGGEEGTVICWVLPISQATRERSRVETRMPSREWAFTRTYGEAFNNELRKFLAQLLASMGYRALAPLLTDLWRVVETPDGLSSTWSERHAAFAAGLGTFSLNDGLITEKGIAHRCGSVITDAIIPPTPRNCADPWSNCLFFRDGGCGLCIPRCPVGAISLNGHDKDKCSAYVYGELRNSAGRLYDIMETGCGLCQTKVPCESSIP